MAATLALAPAAAPDRPARHRVTARRTPSAPPRPSRRPGPAASSTLTRPGSAAGQSTTVWPVPSLARTSRRFAGARPPTVVSVVAASRCGGRPAPPPRRTRRSRSASSPSPSNTATVRPRRPAERPRRAGEPDPVDPVVGERPERAPSCSCGPSRRSSGAVPRTSSAAAPRAPGRRRQAAVGRCTRSRGRSSRPASRRRAPRRRRGRPGPRGRPTTGARRYREPGHGVMGCKRTGSRRR